MRILITGGAGFVGSSLATCYREDYPNAEIVVLDNLRRRGSEINLPKLQKRGVRFQHGDVRNEADLEALPGRFDLFVEASAEPTVLAGLNGSPKYVLQTNLTGTLNCLEFARNRAKRLLFLSTSRVYSIEPLRQIELLHGKTRFEIGERQTLPGVSRHGISERFPTHLPRSLYGASKLASELVIQEYVDTYGIEAVIDRCGVIAGPGQFGKVEQGVFTLWVANHYFGRPLKYTGFGGEGKQVRDLLHPKDLYELLRKQVDRMESVRGHVFNVGGGVEVSTSLLEFSDLCRERTGRSTHIGSEMTTSPVDIPLYVTDHALASQRFDWKPRRSVPDIVGSIADWIRDNEVEIAPLFAG